MGIYIPAPTDTNLAEVVKAYRANATAARRLALYGRSGASVNAYNRRVWDTAEVEGQLSRLGWGHLGGDLHEERVLLRRLSDAKASGQQRPELQARLTTVRRSIKNILAGAPQAA